MNSLTRFAAIDGDDVGVMLRSRIIYNDIDGISSLSAAILRYFNFLSEILQQKGYSIVFCGGDSLLALCSDPIDNEVFSGLPEGPCTISVGIGDTAENAYLALQLAKARGKNQVVELRHTLAETIYKWDRPDGQMS